VVVDVVERQGLYKIEVVYDSDRNKRELFGYPIVHDLKQGLFSSTPKVNSTIFPYGK
jgi:hypothetical protein